MDWIWIGVIISLVLIELVSLNYTAIWFVISGIVSFILLKNNQDYMVQVLTFVILGGLLIIVVRPKIIDKLVIFRDKIISKVTSKYKFFNYIIPKELRNKD
jgi:hypothetical protein